MSCSLQLPRIAFTTSGCRLFLTYWSSPSIFHLSREKKFLPLQAPFAEPFFFSFGNERNTPRRVEGPLLFHNPHLAFPQHAPPCPDFPLLKNPIAVQPYSLLPVSVPDSIPEAPCWIVIFWSQKDPRLAFLFFQAVDDFFNYV